MPACGIENDQRMQEIKRQLEKLFGDTNLTREQTIEAMELVVEEAQGCIEAIRDDIRAEEGG